MSESICTSHETSPCNDWFHPRWWMIFPITGNAHHEFTTKASKPKTDTSTFSCRKSAQLDTIRTHEPMISQCILLCSYVPCLIFSAWWFGCHEFLIFPLILGCCHHPNWRTPSFFRGVACNHQAVLLKSISVSFHGPLVDWTRWLLCAATAWGARLAPLLGPVEGQSMGII